MRDFEEYDRYEALQVKKELARPHCDKCGEPIWDEYLWDIGGEILCENCMNKQYRKWTEDYEE